MNAPEIRPLSAKDLADLALSRFSDAQRSLSQDVKQIRELLAAHEAGNLSFPLFKLSVGSILQQAAFMATDSMRMVGLGLENNALEEVGDV